MTLSALIAALYVVLTLLSFAFGLDKGAVQLRLSEALCVLAALTPAAVPGLFVGCLLSGLLTAAHPLDTVLGSLVTLLAALVCYAMRKVGRHPLGALLLPLPNILFNAFCIPLLLMFVYGVGDAYFALVLAVGAGEVVASGVLGTILFFVLARTLRTRGTWGRGKF